MGRASFLNPENSISFRRVENKVMREMQLPGTSSFIRISMLGIESQPGTFASKVDSAIALFLRVS